MQKWSTAPLIGEAVSEADHKANNLLEKPLMLLRCSFVSATLDPPRWGLAFQDPAMSRRAKSKYCVLRVSSRIWQTVGWVLGLGLFRKCKVLQASVDTVLASTTKAIPEAFHNTSVP